MKIRQTVVVSLVALTFSASASAFWNPKDWDMQDGWGGNKNPMAPMGWGSNDKRGPFGGEHGWGAMDSMMDNMGMGDAFSDLNTDVEWDLNMDTKLKGRAQGEGKAKGKGESKQRSKAQSKARYYGDQYYYPYGPNPYYQGQPQMPAAPYGYAPYPYPVAPAGQMPFAPAMPQMMAPPTGWR